ncbi:hypothetical protein A6R68_15117 [Neotoma lepida]|uniref:Uncharacterized protein n=1 Tax=Neotoma lepida TaxID=56216 RepID=A0A1A6H7Q8_NEOLE|nr:hypothetical protein A6R68_15117 [Neotoma lepida]
MDTVPQQPQRRLRVETTRVFGVHPMHKHQLSVKCVLKHKKEQVKYPPFLEGHCHLFSKEEVGELKREYVPYKGHILSNGNFFPRISQGVYSVAANKSQKKLPRNAGLFNSVPLTQQRSKESEYQLNPWSQKEDNSDLFINSLQVPKHDQNLNNKWPHWEKQKEENKKHSKHGSLSHKRLNHGVPKNPRSLQGNCLSPNTPINQDFLDSIYYRYLKRGADGVCEWMSLLETWS